MFSFKEIFKYLILDGLPLITEAALDSHFLRSCFCNASPVLALAWRARVARTPGETGLVDMALSANVVRFRRITSLLSPLLET